MRIAANVVLVLACALCVAAPRTSYAQQPPQQSRGMPQQRAAPARLPWRFEPSVAETVRQALEYFQVAPHTFGEIRSATHLRALMPILTVNARYDNWAYISHVDQKLMPLITDQSWNQVNYAGSAGMTFDLREAVFNPAEIQVYGLVAVQRDVMLEITRTYFARRQLLIRMAYSPPTETIARDSLLLRIEEFTALLDVLTGGWFSTAARERAQRFRR